MPTKKMVMMGRTVMKGNKTPTTKQGKIKKHRSNQAKKMGRMVMKDNKTMKAKVEKISKQMIKQAKMM